MLWVLIDKIFPCLITRRQSIYKDRVRLELFVCELTRAVRHDDNHREICDTKDIHVNHPIATAIDKTTPPTKDIIVIITDTTDDINTPEEPHGPNDISQSLF